MSTTPNRAPRHGMPVIIARVQARVNTSAQLGLDAALQWGRLANEAESGTIYRTSLRTLIADVESLEELMHRTPTRDVIVERLPTDLGHRDSAMAYYPDLDRCDYFDIGNDELDVLAVGWLAAGRPFSQGPVLPRLVVRLYDLIETIWDPVRFRGRHDCGLCVARPMTMRDGHGREVGVGWTNLFVPALDGGQLFAAPSLVLHYVVDHGYCPPESFQTAVMACARTDDIEYFRRIRPLIPASWIDDVPLFGYREGLGGALAKRAGLMDQHAWDRFWNRINANGISRGGSVPSWFEREHLAPIRALATELTARGEAVDADAVQAWCDALSMQAMALLH